MGINDGHKEVILIWFIYFLVIFFFVAMLLITNGFIDRKIIAIVFYICGGISGFVCGKYFQGG